MIAVELQGVDVLRARLNSLASPRFRRRVLDSMGGVVVIQTRARLGIDKKSPSGERWKPWSKQYARTRGPEHSLLVSSGAMLRSVKHRVMSGLQAVVGSDVVYAGRQHRSRPFMGLSHEDRAQAESVARGVVVDALVGGA